MSYNYYIIIYLLYRYRAPEVLGKSSDYGMEADVWSLGCSFYEFVTGNSLCQVIIHLFYLFQLLTN